MALDSSPRRGADPLARAWSRHFIGVDELDFYKSANLSLTRDNEENAKMGKLLSPIDEEGCYGMSYHDDAPLAVHLTVRFNDAAIRSVHSQSFYSSRSFRPSDRICRGLIRRIDHCSQELITRKDADALHNMQCLRKGPKQWRFEMSFKIAVKGHSGAWAERILISYQKQSLNQASAEQVLRSANSIVGLFFQRHDKEFHWRDRPFESCLPDRPETFRPDDGAANLACIPRSLFLESTQNCEFVPGYTLRLVLKSNDSARGQPSIAKTSRIDSAQASPLHLELGQDLLWKAVECVQDALDCKANSLEKLDTDSHDRPPHVNNALGLEVDVVNNLGPVFDHLHRSIQSGSVLFDHLDSQDCDEFVDRIRQQFKMLRSKTDDEIEKLHDFDFRIAELIGNGWHETDCARFTVDGKHKLGRQDVEALIERIRTAAGDVLKEQDVVIRMIAYKRGHLVLDKALVARDRRSGPSDSPHVLVDRLKARIRKDIDMICKDTCSLDDIPEVAPSRPFVATPRQSPPGSPASLRTQPATPSKVPRRIASRVFPLVPIKYKDASDAGSVSSRSPIPPVILEDEGFPGLKPAAEVFRAADFDVESNSTHSSMPTLAESDTPSPDHSMLITPSYVRPSLHTPRGLSFEDHRFSSLPTDEISASSRTSFSEAHEWDGTSHSVPVSTPKLCKETHHQDVSGSCHGSVTKEIACPPTKTVGGPETEESPEHNLPTEGWLLHCIESDEDEPETAMESQSSTTAAPEGKPAEILSLPEDSIGGTGEAHILKHDIDAPSHSGPAEVSETVKEEEGPNPEQEAVKETCTRVGQSVSSGSARCPVGVSEESESGCHVTLVSTSDFTSEACNISGAEYGERLFSDGESMSGPSMNRDGALGSPIVTEPALTVTIEASEAEKSSISPLAHTASAPKSGTYLTPEPDSQKRQSWSSSSEWEDWVSESRHSCDSVDTFKASIHPSIAEEQAPPLDSPKRLRTPTAGLLGLSESRWADFGIRSALTGTHAFDVCRPSTAPMLVDGCVPEAAREEQFELRDEATKPATPRKTRHLKHKKSIGSILFMGAAPNKLNKKPSKDLKKVKTKAQETETVEDTGRFPRAMMLVAGLAFASSIVSRNST